jgi:hypothetical protein
MRAVLFSPPQQPGDTLRGGFIARRSHLHHTMETNRDLIRHCLEHWPEPTFPPDQMALGDTPTSLWITSGIRKQHIDLVRPTTQAALVAAMRAYRREGLMASHSSSEKDD